MTIEYSTLIRENGFLTTDGEEYFNSKIMPSVKELLAGMHTENEIRIMASILSNLIGKEGANTILALNEASK